MPKFNLESWVPTHFLSSNLSPLLFPLSQIFFQVHPFLNISKLGFNPLLKEGKHTMLIKFLIGVKSNSSLRGVGIEASIHY